MQNKFETINHFYLELINRFFHRKSYFYFCISDALENRTSELATIDNTSLQIISKFIHYLIESPQPALELKEITQIRTFNNFYSELEEQLHRLNLKSLDQSQLKIAIKNYAHYFMTKLIRILANEPNSRTTLEKYINIKSNLRSMLNTSDPKKTPASLASVNHLKVYRAPRTKHNQPDTKSAPQKTSQLKATKKTSATFNNNILQGFFEEEIFELLKPLTKSGTKFPGDENSLSACFESFLNIKEISMYHGHEEIEAIAGRVVKILKKFRDAHKIPDKHAIELIAEAKSTIEKYVFHHQSIENFTDHLQKYDVYLDGEKSNDQFKMSEAEPEFNNETSQKEDFGIDDDKITKSKDNDKETPEKHENGKKITDETPIVSENDDTIDKDLLDFKLPGEEDEELLNFLQEITPHSKMENKSEDVRDRSDIEEGDDQESETEAIEPESENEAAPAESEDKSDNLIESFHEEVDLYHKVISNAVTQLTRDQNYQNSLEDIELASASMNQLAQKFGLDKIAFLPEIMEAICFQANKRRVKLPLKIVDNMEKGVSLLKRFDRENSDHKIQFVSILTALKEYYIATFGMQGINSSSGM